MRILHFSDVHVGVETYGRTDPETGLSTRLLDFLKTFDELVDFAIEEQVDLALFCGDAYKSRDPSQTHQREFARRIARLSFAGVPVFLLLGNHDMPHVTSRATAIEIFRTLDVRNVYVGDTLRTYSVPTRSGPIQIVALPWVRRSDFLTREDTRSMSPPDVNEAIQRRLADGIAARAAALDPGVPAVFAGHVSVAQAKTGSEQAMILGHDHVLLKSDVALPQFDYVALGHVHRHQRLGDAPPVVYSGSLERVDFGEENDEKGFCVIELDPAEQLGRRLKSLRFQLVDARRFTTVSVSVPKDDLDPTATVVRAIRACRVQDAIVRVLIEVSSELASHVRDNDVRAALDGAHYVATISKDVTADSTTRLPPGSAVLKPRDALKLYLEGRSLPTGRIERLLRHADKLMEDVSLE